MRSIADLPGPNRLPLLGNLHQVSVDRLHLTVEEWGQRYGPVFRFDLGPRRIVAVGDAREINAILRDRPGGFRRMRELGDALEEMGVGGVFSAEGSHWKRQRRLAIAGLNANHLHRYFHVIRTMTERLQRRLTEAARDGHDVDIAEAMAAYTIDVTTALAFGHDLNMIERGDSELQRHIHTVFEAVGRRVSAPVPYWRWFRLPADRAAGRSLAELHRAVEGFIERTRAAMEARPELHEKPENFLQSMVAAQAAEGTFTDGEIIGNTLTLLGGGEDTTASTLAWSTWFLATRPEVQERFAHEAGEVLGDDRFPDDEETVDRLRYGEAVLREVLRLKPPTPYLLLESLTETAIAETRIPAGTRLFLLTRQAGLGSGGLERPTEFDPDRWLGDGGGAPDFKAFLTFGAGPRFCPGRNLAFLEAKSALAMLVRNFELELSDSSGPVEERFAFTMGPVGLSLRLRERRRVGAVA